MCMAMPGVVTIAINSNKLNAMLMQIMDRITAVQVPILLSASGYHATEGPAV